MGQSHIFALIMLVRLITMAVSVSCVNTVWPVSRDTEHAVDAYFVTKE